MNKIYQDVDDLVDDVLYYRKSAKYYSKIYKTLLSRVEEVKKMENPYSKVNYTHLGWKTCHSQVLELLKKGRG